MSKYIEYIFVLASIMTGVLVCHFFVDSASEMRAEYENTYYGDVRLAQAEEVYIVVYASEQQDTWLLHSLLTGVDSNFTDTHYLNFKQCLSYLNVSYVKRSVDAHELHDVVEACLLLTDVIVD